MPLVAAATFSLLIGPVGAQNTLRYLVYDIGFERSHFFERI